MHKAKCWFEQIIILFSIFSASFHKVNALHCYVCSSENSESSSSLEADIELQLGLCTKDVSSCYTKIQNGTTTRGCFPSYNSPLKFDCSDSEEDSVCKLCFLNKCNGNILSKTVLAFCEGSNCKNQANIIENLVKNKKREEIQTCIKCDSEADSKCIDQPETFDEIICNSNNPSVKEECYLSIENEKVKRGCVNDLDEEQKLNCKSQSDTCKTCIGNNCNKKITFQACITCNNKAPSECYEFNPDAEIVICYDYLGTCIVGINGNGYTHRRCSKTKAIDDTELPNGYEKCSKNRCNIDRFPKDRLQCYQCDDCDLMSNFSALERQQIIPKSCSFYSTEDYCYTYLNKDKSMYRGCLSDSSNNRLLCENNSSKCEKCSKSRCNSQPKLTSPMNACIKCRNFAECAFGHDPFASVACKTDVPFLKNESCYTYSIKNSNIVERGCTLDVEVGDSEWCTKKDECESCDGQKCNIENVRRSWCLVCNSDADKECLTVKDENQFHYQCDRSAYPYSKRGCFTKKENGTVTRGCLKDLNDAEYEACRQVDYCTLCKDDNCNKQPVSGSRKASITCLLVFSIFLNFYLIIIFIL